MNSHKYLFLEKYSKVGSIVGIFTFAFLIIGLITDDAHANFATTESSTVAACPANHKMYYVGANPPSSSTPAPNANVPVVYLPLSWTSGSESKAFTFIEASGNKVFNIVFSEILDLNSDNRPKPPFYDSFDGVTSSAINLSHNSTTAKKNHVLKVDLNRSASKIGYKIQDVDSTTTRSGVPYIEEVDVSANNGQLTYNIGFQTINPEKNKVTGISGVNCAVGACTIDASWNYSSANTPLQLAHNNFFSNTAGTHTVGYSDFYFCLAPPKLIVKKALNGTRFGTDDEFEISTRVDENLTLLNQFTTTGDGSTLGNSSSSVQNLKENTTYTISERVTNGGSINNYNATYNCLNSSTGSNSTTLIGSGSSFKLSGLNYGDEITCTITNTPKSYTFTGFVFNDNGGITASDSTKQNISTTFTSNANYFNGIFDSSGSNKESGIGASGLQVRLTNCGPNGGTDISGTSAQNISASASPGLLLGQYRFTVPASVIAILSPQKVCVMQVEPGSWKDSTNVSDYSVDTTPNTREVALVANTFDYKTESNGSRDLDFGEVQANNASLVLVKSQYVHNCNINTNFNGTTGTPSQTPVFSIAEIKDIEPGKCIAYRIEAYNRGHVDLKDIQINDQLQVKSQTNLVTSVFALPVPKGDPTSLYTGTTLPTGTITSELFNLNKPTGSTPTKATLYFNTKYGTTMDTQ
ncbi:hypothetical protein CXF61_03670 [Psychrobacter sp. 4Dc]|uniref:hypothetical protein n=1 Tax=Psychrobacter sp. 4Dc TaxID=888437 RepID=UPI000CC2AFC5|nr:hypothetical protein [Psychrobacter sp. 4Dc]PKH65998.1 hypothetical protein CXF61_03670 [Psychrobacter sp. 4Dc]